MVNVGDYYSINGNADMGYRIEVVDIDTGRTQCLALLGKGVGGFHISRNSMGKPGWVVVSVYMPLYANMDTDWAEHLVFR
jgi:hypothetical protein